MYLHIRHIGDRTVDVDHERIGEHFKRRDVLFVVLGKAAAHRQFEIEVDLAAVGSYNFACCCKTRFLGLAVIVH